MLNGSDVTCDYENMAKNIISGRCKYAIADEGTALTMIHESNCGEIVSTTDVIASVANSIILRKNWEHNHVIDQTTLLLQENGLLPTVEQYIVERSKCQVLIAPRVTTKMLRVFFFLVFGSCGLLLAYMIVDPSLPRRNDCDCEDDLES